MDKPAKLLLFCLLLVANIGLTSAQTKYSPDMEFGKHYQLATGDTVNIHVFQESDLSVEEKVSDTGTITYPLLGVLKVAGLTIERLQKIVHDGLEGYYLVNPRVNVKIIQYRNFYINGYVEKPGPYPFVPGLTARKAISIAGGFKDRAYREAVRILREGKPEGKGEKEKLDIKVFPGDIVTVDRSFF